MECTVHIGGAGLITIRLLASPVQSLWSERKKMEGFGYTDSVWPSVRS